ncbi:hypothetical protein BGZ73_008524, partial [Actinomortierella ambigua]
MVAMSFDVIALIIEQVEDRNTLFSLLTINRQIFRQTCMVLYRDPFRFSKIRYLASNAAGRKTMHLLQLLLTLSPAADDEANLVRSAYGVPPKNKSEAEAPLTMLNYLSFVRCARWTNHVGYYVEAVKDKGLLYKAANSSGFTSTASFVHGTAIRMICHDRLDDIVELEMGADTVDRYIDLVPHLSCLRYISIPSYTYDINMQTEQLFLPSVRFIQAFQQHYGKDRLLDYSAFDGDYSIRYDYFCERVGIAKLLPPRFPHTLKLAHPVRPMDSYVSRLETLVTRRGPPSWWEEFSEDYTDMSAGHILQRCRSLVTLDLDCADGGIHDGNVFRWAANEARQRARRELSVPAVLLENLNLTMIARPLAMALQILMDAFVGFSQSLQSLQVEYRQSYEEVDEEAEGEGDSPILPEFENALQAMTQLKEVRIKSTDPRLVDDRLLTICTNLTSLRIFLDDSKDTYGCLHGWSEVHMPKLKRLMLKGSAINLFDPASLHRMPRLQSLLLSGICEDAGSSRDEGPPPRNRCWTWDWHLPMLIDLKLEQIAFSSSGFSFKVLRGCPSLVRLTIGFPEFEEQQQALFPIDIVSALTDCTQDVFPNLAVLELLGRYSLLAEDLEALIGRVLP